METTAAGTVAFAASVRAAAAAAAAVAVAAAATAAAAAAACAQKVHSSSTADSRLRPCPLLAIAAYSLALVPPKTALLRSRLPQLSRRLRCCCGAAAAAVTGCNLPRRKWVHDAVAHCVDLVRQQLSSIWSDRTHQMMGQSMKSIGCRAGKTCTRKRRGGDRMGEQAAVGWKGEVEGPIGIRANRGGSWRASWGCGAMNRCRWGREG